MKNIIFSAVVGLAFHTSLFAGELGEILRDTLRHPQIEAAQALKNAAQMQQDAAAGRYLEPSLFTLLDEEGRP